MLVATMLELSDSFSRLTWLDTVVLETGRDLGAKDVQWLFEALFLGCWVPVYHRTCDDAHRIALHAKNGSSGSADAGLLSPFWCFEEHAWRWSHW